MRLKRGFFRSMNNSVCGKTMETLRNTVDVTSEKFCLSKEIQLILALVHKIRGELTLNKPAHVRMCLLDLSKTLMYDFHYDYTKNKYEDKARLLFTDTDSLLYEKIHTRDAI